jgi:hypothetical protein
MKPVLKAPGTMLLTLGYDEQLSNFAFKFKLRRYTKAAKAADKEHTKAARHAEEEAAAALKAGRCPLLAGAGRCWPVLAGAGRCRPVLDHHSLTVLVFCSALLKINCDELLSNGAFNFNLRPSIKASEKEASKARKLAEKDAADALVGRCRLPLSKSEVKARLVLVLETRM